MRDLLADVPDIGWRQLVGALDVCGGVLGRKPAGLFPNGQSRVCETWQIVRHRLDQLVDVVHRLLVLVEDAAERDERR